MAKKKAVKKAASKKTAVKKAATKKAGKKKAATKKATVKKAGKKKATVKKAGKKKTTVKKAAKKKAATKKAATKKAAPKKASTKKAATKKAAPQKAAAEKVATQRAAVAVATPDVSEDGLRWIEADKDYAVALEAGKLVCRNPKGKRLASVPKWLKDAESSQQLIALKDWLAEHQRQCLETTEMWMLRSLPVPRKVLASVWPDPAWKDRLLNAVVCAVKKDQLVQEEAGFLREVHETKGVGIIDLDGETQWIKTDTVAIPHPILLEELDDFRELTVELSFEQQLDQLFRQTWKPTAEQTETTSIEEYSGGKFEMLNHALGLCRRLGYKVSGGYACCPVWEAGTLVEARFWVGAEYPEEETYTGDLIFADERDKTLPVKDVGAVAFSEGVRMAASIYAKRVVEKADDE